MAKYVVYKKEEILPMFLDFLLVRVLVSCACSMALNNRNLFSHSSGSQNSRHGIAGPKSRCRDGSRLPGVSGGGPDSRLSRPLVAAGLPWLVATSL